MNRTELAFEIRQQRAWIFAHGETEAGYCERYGDADIDPVYYGNGGKAIFEADYNYLKMLEKQFEDNYKGIVVGMA